MNNDQFARGLMTLGYRDYLASRFLINNGFVIQGVVLASSAVEKYLKLFLAKHGIKKKVHLNNLDDLKKALEITGYHVIFDKLDPVFLDLLGKAYKYRYYDDVTVKHADTIGFIIHQFIGELDYTVFLINKLFSITDAEGNIVLNEYQRDIQAKNPTLFLNNYILNKIPKKDFMNQKGNAFGLHISPDFLGTEIEINGTNVQGEYNGKIWYINVTNGKSKDDE